MRNSKLKIFYTPKQVLQVPEAGNYSKSPLKPRLVVNKLLSLDGSQDMFEVVDSFRPFNHTDFYMAHEFWYVNEFFQGILSCNSNGLRWSPQFADSVRYTNASLYNAIKQAVVSRGRDLCFAPTSGFHHAGPDGGSGFCTFSGQVIASTKLYREFGVSGAYIDLDGHFGNSIEDSREFVKDLDKSIPRGCNVNPTGKNEAYYRIFCSNLEYVKSMILNDKIHYVVWCHGADSHEWDQLGSQCSTKYWMKCAQKFWNWVKEIDEELGRPLPVAFALFGGYRDDDYNSVINLHVADTVEGMNTLLNKNINFDLVVKEPFAKRYLD